MHPVEPDRGIRGIRDERIAGFVWTSGTRRWRADPGKLVQDWQDLARPGRPGRSTLPTVGQDDLTVILIAGAAEGTCLPLLGDADRHSRHCALEPGKDFSVEICHPRIRRGHVNRHKQPLRKLTEQLLIGQRERVAPIRGDVDNCLCLRRHGDHDRGPDDDEHRTFDPAREQNAGWQPDRCERQKAHGSN